MAATALKRAPLLKRVPPQMTGVEELTHSTSPDPPPTNQTRRGSTSSGPGPGAKKVATITPRFSPQDPDDLA